VPPRKRANGNEPLGFEDVLWKAANKLRGAMDASEYKHVVLPGYPITRPDRGRRDDGRCA
jgi:HsdM N-terminal domain